MRTALRIRCCGVSTETVEPKRAAKNATARSSTATKEGAPKPRKRETVAKDAATAKGPEPPTQEASADVSTATKDLQSLSSRPLSQSNGSKASAAAGQQEGPQTSNPMDIVFVSAEVAPWSKTGGLGDVIGSLPIALAKRGHRVMVVAPRYQHGVAKSDSLYNPAQLLETRATLDLGECGQQEVGFYHLHQNSVDFVFVDHPCYQRAGNPYADENGAFGDNQFRYTLLSMAACEAPLQLPIGGFRSGTPPGFPYGENVIFLANDWHAGLVPAYVAGKYRRNGVYKDARCIIAIHNLSHQGVDPAATYANLGLPADWYDPLSWEYPTWASINGPAVNILKGAVAVADRVLTVSQGYAWEITTKEGGWGMDGVLQSRQHVLNGIANGIDMEEWDPATDSTIPKNYSSKDLAGKQECKAALQKELGLAVDPSVPLLGFIGRLDHQKGPDIVLDAVPELTARNCQVVMLGSGVQEFETRMREMENSHSSHFRGWVGFSVDFAHRMIAACDIILMPSRFEPCGLNQLFAMRYGTIPIAHATGGLRDTIQEFNPFAEDGKVGTGWTYSPCDVPAMLDAVDLALTTYRSHPDSWEALMLSGMSQDLSWNKAAEQYEQIFEWAFMDPPARAD